MHTLDFTISAHLYAIICLFFVRFINLLTSTRSPVTYLGKKQQNKGIPKNLHSGGASQIQGN